MSRLKKPKLKGRGSTSFPKPQLTPVNIILSILIFTAIGAVIGSLTTYALLQSQKPKPIQKTQNDFIKEFYQVENAVYISPHSLRKSMDKGSLDVTLVDLRSPQEYEASHIIGAINIPAYSDPNTSAYGEEERIASQFAQLVKLDKSKDIVVYCYSMPCMTGRKIGLMLTKHNIFVKHLGIGWNEWRYFWSLWNHDAETPTFVENYIVSGKNAGTPRKIETAPASPFTPCTEGSFGC